MRSYAHGRDRQHPHPYIVDIHGFCATDDALTIVMEFCQNGTLYDMIHENKVTLFINLLVFVLTAN